MQMQILMIPRQLQILESPYKTACRLYEDSERINVDVCLSDLKLPVPAALIDAEDLESFIPRERYAGTMSGMFFITQQTPLIYRPFAAFHELAEHAAPKGFDFTGLAKHFQALVVELGYAKHILSQQEFETYARWRKSVEQSNFFELNDNGLIDKAREEIEKIFRAMPQYLTYKRRKLVELVEEGK